MTEERLDEILDLKDEITNIEDKRKRIEEGIHNVVDYNPKLFKDSNKVKESLLKVLRDNYNDDYDKLKEEFLSM